MYSLNVDEKYNSKAAVQLALFEISEYNNRRFTYRGDPNKNFHGRHSNNLLCNRCVPTNCPFSFKEKKTIDYSAVSKKLPHTCHKQYLKLRNANWAYDLKMFKDIVTPKTVDYKSQKQK